MDNRGNNKKITLGSLKFTDFYDALQEDNPMLVGIKDESIWYGLFDEFINLLGTKQNSLKKRFLYPRTRSSRESKY